MQYNAESHGSYLLDHLCVIHKEPSLSGVGLPHELIHGCNIVNLRLDVQHIQPVYLDLNSKGGLAENRVGCASIY